MITIHIVNPSQKALGRRVHVNIILTHLLKDIRTCCVFIFKICTKKKTNKTIHILLNKLKN